MGEIKKSPDPMKPKDVKGFLKMCVSVCDTERETKKDECTRVLGTSKKVVIYFNFLKVGQGLYTSPLNVHLYIHMVCNSNHMIFFGYRKKRKSIQHSIIPKERS